jgi:endonuclease/exonuclease/phosphatase family metal-dependent hydrolase
VRIATFNVHGWQTPDAKPNVDLVADLLAGCNADVVALNEVWHPFPPGDSNSGRRASKGNGLPAALVVLAERLGMAYAFGAVAPAETPGGDRIPYGNAVLSRWPIVAYATHRLPAGSYAVPRGLLEARLSLAGGRNFTLYATHLDHRSEPARLEQWAAAQTWLVRERGRAHAVVGDFNALAHSDYTEPGTLEALQAVHEERGWGPPVFDLTKRILSSGYVDAFAHRGQGAGATWPAHRPERRVDYVFLPPETIAVAASRRCDGPAAVLASDHLAICADIELI